MRFTRRTIGKAMIAIGCVGVIVSVVGVIVGQQLIAQVEESVDDSLVLTSDGLAAVEDSIALTSTIVETLQGGLATIDATLQAVHTSVAQTGTALTNSGDFLGGSFPDSLDAVARVLPNIQNIAEAIDEALRVASRAPLIDIDYDPDQPFDEAIAELSTALGPIPEQMRELADDTDGLAATAAEISDQVSALSDHIEMLDAQLVQVSDLVARYSDTTSRATRLTAESRADLETSSDQTRTLLVLLGAVFALGQVVPIWLGISLLGRGPTHVVTRTHTEPDPDELDDDPE
jgi:hypothetical protein